jgi:hypothetical protein
MSIGDDHPWDYTRDLLLRECSKVSMIDMQLHKPRLLPTQGERVRCDKLGILLRGVLSERTATVKNRRLSVIRTLRN